MVFEPGALGPPRLIYDLYISERFFFSSGSISLVFIFLSEATGTFVFAGEIIFSIGFLFGNFGAGFGTNSSSSSSFSSRVR
jgi:hypothetical protein